MTISFQGKVCANVTIVSRFLRHCKFLPSNVYKNKQHNSKCRSVNKGITVSTDWKHFDDATRNTKHLKMFRSFKSVNENLLLSRRGKKILTFVRTGRKTMSAHIQTFPCITFATWTKPKGEGELNFNFRLVMTLVYHQLQPLVTLGLSCCRFEYQLYP